MLRCTACHRRLLLPAYTAPSGRGAYVLGPVCAQKAGLLPEHKRKSRAGGRLTVGGVMAGQLELGLEDAGQPQR